jgi:hypothetical protein
MGYRPNSAAIQLRSIDIWPLLSQLARDGV